MAQGTELIKIEKLHKGDKYISAAYLTRIYEICDSPRDKAYIMYHAETGLRVSDVVKTNIGHIDWREHRTYTFDHKKDEWRFIYWPGNIKGQLQQWLKYRQAKGIKSELLFPFSERTASRIINKWAVLAGHPLGRLVSSHWLRHTYIRLSKAAGRDIKAVQQNTGDTILTLLNWYSDLDQDSLKRQAEVSIR